MSESSVSTAAPSLSTPAQLSEGTRSLENEALLRRLQDAERAIQQCLQTYDEHEEDVQSTVADLELSVVMPCLNEADTVAICIEKAQRAMAEHGIRGEVIVADNGSTDGSIEIAKESGARVVHITEKGYGNALRGGIAASTGKYVIMGDSDDSYDFLEIPKFVDKLREGHDLVQGCRLPSGGGTVLRGAMPLSHRWIGNPMFTMLVRGMFNAPIHDVYCGLRGFTREHYEKLDLRASGMEFATEMIIKSSLFKSDIAEVPTTLHPDGRMAHAPHLRTIRDGWRTLRFFMMFSPRWLFLAPGAGLAFLGAVGYSLALPGAQMFGASLDAHTLLVASLCLLLGFQLVQFAAFAKTFATLEGLAPPNRHLERLSNLFCLERCLGIGALAFASGIAMLANALSQWQAVGFGSLDYATTMRWVIPGVTLAALGFQTIFASFFISILRMARRGGSSQGSKPS